MATLLHDLRFGMRMLAKNPGFTALAAACLAMAPMRASAQEGARSDPWKASELVEPQELARMISGHAATRPAIISVGFEILYKNGHIPGALFLGPGREAKGLRALKSWAKNLDRHREVILYCGCCPWGECPNIRPAYTALKGMGFVNLKVLRLEQDFARDWVEKGYPEEKGK